MSGFKFDADKRLYLGAQGGALVRPGIARERFAGVRNLISLPVGEMVWRGGSDHSKAWEAPCGVDWLEGLYPVGSCDIGPSLDGGSNRGGGAAIITLYDANGVQLRSAQCNVDGEIDGSTSRLAMGDWVFDFGDGEPLTSFNAAKLTLSWDSRAWDNPGPSFDAFLVIYDNRPLPRWRVPQ